MSKDRLQSRLEHIPFGLYEKALPASLSWPERLTIAAQVGYDFMEIAIDDTDARIERLDWPLSKRVELRNIHRSTGVPIKSMSLSAHRRFPLGSTSARTRQTALDIIKKAIDFTLDIGIRVILVAGADAYHEGSTPQSQARFLEGLERAFEWASAAGVMLALENWDIQVDSVQKAMTYVHYFDSPWFQLYVDIGNLAYAGYDVISELELGQGHIAAVHVKDTLPGQLRYVPPGKGVVPFVSAFAKLAQMGFQGLVALELWTEDLPDSVEIVTQAHGWLREQMRAGWQQAAQAGPNSKE